MLKVSDKLPDGTLMQWNGSEIVSASVADIFEGSDVLAVGVVGAFTPVCAGSHIVEYVPMVDLFKQTGHVNRIICVSAADPFVMHAWGDNIGAGGKIEMWSDPDAAFAKAIGITADFSALGLGIRSGRFSLVAHDREVTTLNVEDDPGVVTVSGAEKMREQLAA